MPSSHRFRRPLFHPTLALAIIVGGCGATSPAPAETPLRDYSFVRGVNYTLTNDVPLLERDLGYAKRVNLNSTRIWLNFKNYEEDPKNYIEKIRIYIRTAHRLGFTTMPILFNGNGLDPTTLRPAFRARGETYVKAIVEALKDEPGLLMWDVMNEPFTNDYHDKASNVDRAKRENEITQFLRHYLSFVKSVDNNNALTVGYTFSNQLEPTADLVDVLSFHDYTETRAKVENAYHIALDISRKFNKPMMNTETGCIARGNPYDEILQIAAEHRTGFYIYNLIIQGYWGEIHGVFYPDGTVRDPATVAALMGFYRKRDPATMILPLPNREGSAEKAIYEIEAALKDSQDSFQHKENSSDQILDAAEHAANLLEAAEMVPMDMPPTARIAAWRQQAPEQRDRAAIRAFAYDLGQKLKERTLLF